MNNKGFGLQEVLLFIGCSMIALIAISIYCAKNFGESEDIKTSNISNPIVTPSTIDNSNEYIKLENKLVSASKKYKFNKNENIVISLEHLKRANLITNLIDPFDNSIKCNGYVYYSYDKKTYTPYINCPGMYVTNNYNSDFDE